jgi:tripartite-type tricarboxylate transporter receptor subunit TctC
MIRTKARNDVDAQALDFVLAREVIGRPFAAPPGIPASRAKLLREAFMATLKDPDFLKEAEKSQLDVSPVSGAEAEALLHKASAASPEVIKRVLGPF